jgi:hypothetical protein
MQRLSMLKDTRVRNSVTQAFEKAAEAEADDARKEIIESFDGMAAHCRKWLSANGEPVDDGPVPGVSDSELADYTRGVNMHTNVPADVEELGSLSELYAAEGNLLNRTQRALMEHQLRFNQSSNDATHTPIADIIRNMQAFAAKVRGFVLTDFKTLVRVLIVTAERLMI